MVEGEGRRLGAIADADLVVDIGDMALDSGDADDKLGRNFFVGGARADQAQHLDLARSEITRVAARGFGLIRRRANNLRLEPQGAPLADRHAQRSKLY